MTPGRVRPSVGVWKLSAGVAIGLFVSQLAACAARATPSPTTTHPGSTGTEVPALRAPAPPDGDGEADAAALIRLGCFACLQRAFASARQQKAPHLAFEAAVLLALRSKELGMPPGEWIEEARALAGDTAAFQFMLEVADGIPADPLSGARDEALAQSPRRLRAAALSPRWREALASGPGSLELRTYLQLALTCASEAFAMTPDEAAAAVPPTLNDVPLLRYRLGICGIDHAPVLRDLRGSSREFVDADYALARYAVRVRGYPDLDEALRLLRSAADAFPRSPAIATMAGDLNQTIEAWADSLAAYDAALALVANHPDALIGRTITLSHLGRHRDAIETATRLIGEGEWFMAQAYYWRAWNRFQLDEYAVARDDADRARAMMVNSGVHLLSGMIDWRLRRLESAEREFEEALGLDRGQCEAATFLGGVRNERKRMPEALEAFTQAVECYELTVRRRREAIARLETSEATAAHKAREIARHQRAIEQAESRRVEALNGADLLQKYLKSIQARPQSRRR